MPVRMMTDEEKENIFGSGFIVIGQQMPVPGKQDSAPSGTPPKAGVSVRYANKEKWKGCCRKYPSIVTPRLKSEE